LTDLLSQKLKEVGPHADIARWISGHRFLPNTARPSYLDRALEDALDMATESLGFDAEEARQEAQRAS
jgi:hypothetical protein